MRRSHELPEEIHGAFLRGASKSIQYELPLISKAFSNLICLGCKSGSAWWSRSIGNRRKLKPAQTYCFHLFHRGLLFKGPPPLFLQVSAADYCSADLMFATGIVLCRGPDPDGFRERIPWCVHEGAQINAFSIQHLCLHVWAPLVSHAHTLYRHKLIGCHRDGGNEWCFVMVAVNRNSSK